MYEVIILQDDLYTLKSDYCFYDCCTFTLYKTVITGYIDIVLVERLNETDVAYTTQYFHINDTIYCYDDISNTYVVLGFHIIDGTVKVDLIEKPRDDDKSTQNMKKTSQKTTSRYLIDCTKRIYRTT
jgi:hypothetical protein